MKYIFLSFRELFYFSLVFLFGLAVPHGLWDLGSQPRIEPKPPAVKHGVLTTGLPGNSESSFILVCMYVCIQKQKNCSLNSDKWIPVCKLCYVKRACISLGYWWVFRGLGSSSLHGMNPHTGCLLKDGVEYFFWNLKREVGTCSSRL